MDRLVGSASNPKMALNPERKQKIDGLTEEELRAEFALGPQYARYQGESYKYIGVRLAEINQKKADAVAQAQIRSASEAELANAKTWRIGWWQVGLAILGIVVALGIFYYQR